MPIDYARLATAPKMLAQEPEWFFDRRSEAIYICSTALQIDYVTEEGLFLEAHALSYLPEQDVTFVLTHKPAAGLAGPLARVDWNPHHTHNNKGLIAGPFARREIRGSHVHPFAENYARDGGWEAMVADNLPLAFPIWEDLRNFREVLAFVGHQFAVVDIQRIPEPQWSERLV